MKNMKAAMILFDSELREEIFMLMKLVEIAHYTLLPNLFGSGNQGKKEGSIAWPGNNEIMLLVVSPDQYENVKKEIHRYKASRASKEGLLLLSWSLDEVIV